MDIRIKHGPQRPQSPARNEPFHTWYDRMGGASAQFFRDGDDYMARFPAIADFSVRRDGLEVTCHRVNGVGDATIEHLWQNQVRPLALAQQGHHVFHASAVALDDTEAIAFLGPSGRGKSTLAAAFAMRGHSFLTDDVLILQSVAHAWHAESSPSALRLWDDSYKEILKDLDSPRTLTAFGKTITESGTIPKCHNTRRLRSAYVISETQAASAVEISRLPLADSVVAWLANGFALDLVEHGALRTQFDRVCTVAEGVRTFRLSYPRGWSRLPEVLDQILVHGQL